MVFPVVMYGCESWTIKKAEHWRTNSFELWCWRRLLRVPWTARISNQFITKEISPEYSLEGLIQSSWAEPASPNSSHYMVSTRSLKSLLSPASCFWRWWGPSRSLREQSPNTSSFICLFVNSSKGTRSPIRGILIKTSDSPEKKSSNSWCLQM